MKLWKGPLLAREESERTSTTYPLSFQGYVDMFSGWNNYMIYNNNEYPVGIGGETYQRQNVESSGGGFSSLVTQAYYCNGVVFACVLARMLLFSEARFQYRRFNNGRPGDLFGSTDLAILETPAMSDLLSQAEQDVSFAGNWFSIRKNNLIVRLRPDWVDIISADEYGSQVLGYAYWYDGRSPGYEPDLYLADQVAHYKPIPDPLARFRGMSWVTPIVREIQADSMARDHKIEFFSHGGTNNTVYRIDPKSMTAEQFDQFVDKFQSAKADPSNAYKAIWIRAAADPTVLGSNFEEMDFKQVQGAGETRIAAAAGVPPVIVGLSEGLQAATYSNYSQARRRFADGTMRPLWRNFAGSLQTLVPPPPGAQLWYDDRDIQFLKEDEKDSAEVNQLNATTARTLIDAGFVPDTVVAAIASGDMTRLRHSGLVSVQLQEPGAQPASSNGNGNAATVALPSG